MSAPAGTLRAKIEAAIRKNAADPEQAAWAVCLLLEDEIGLFGNGWFDSDDAMLAALGEP